MRIEKINEHQIRCTLYQKDLKDREIRISELAYGTEKARALFRDMMQQASYEFGFEADDIPLMIEAIPMLPDALILLITKVEDPDELDTRFSNFTDDPSELYLDDSSTDDFVIINDDEEFDADDFDIDGPDSAEDMNIEQMLNEVNSQTKWPGHGKADAVLDQLFHDNVQKESKDNKANADKNKPDINLEHPMEPDVDVNEALVYSHSPLSRNWSKCASIYATFIMDLIQLTAPPLRVNIISFCIEGFMTLPALPELKLLQPSTVHLVRTIMLLRSFSQNIVKF